MMKFIVTLIAVIGFALSFQILTPEHDSGIIKADTTGQNPNGASELALLMRDMQKFTNQAKEDLRTGKTPPVYPRDFDKVHTAKVTENMNKSDFYTQFADLYIMSVKNYTSSKPEQRIETYNNMVSACLACHSQHCPGPVPVIKKMMWDVK
jgi:hypothetical protein